MKTDERNDNSSGVGLDFDGSSSDSGLDGAGVGPGGSGDRTPGGKGPGGRSSSGVSGIDGGHSSKRSGERVGGGVGRKDGAGDVQDGDQGSDSGDTGADPGQRRRGSGRHPNGCDCGFCGNSKRQSADRGSSGDSGGSEPSVDAPASAVRPVATKPKTAGFKDTVSSDGRKYKKGYAPLLDKTNSIEVVDNGFGVLGLLLGSHWGLDESESKELGSRLFRVLQCFPVKLENNPEILEKIMALIALAVGIVVVCGDRVRITRETKNSGILGKLTQKSRPETATGTISGNTNTAPGVSGPLFDDGGAIRPGGRFEAGLGRRDGSAA